MSCHPYALGHMPAPTFLEKMKMANVATVMRKKMGQFHNKIVIRNRHRHLLNLPVTEKPMQYSIFHTNIAVDVSRCVFQLIQYEGFPHVSPFDMIPTHFTIAIQALNDCVRYLQLPINTHFSHMVQAHPEVNREPHEEIHWQYTRSEWHDEDTTWNPHFYCSYEGHIQCCVFDLCTPLKENDSDDIISLVFQRRVNPFHSWTVNMIVRDALYNLHGLVPVPMKIMQVPCP